MAKSTPRKQKKVRNKSPFKGINKALKQKARQPLDGGAVIPVAGYS